MFLKCLYRLLGKIHSGGGGGGDGHGLKIVCAMRIKPCHALLLLLLLLPPPLPPLSCQKVGEKKKNKELMSSLLYYSYFLFWHKFSLSLFHSLFLLVIFIWGDFEILIHSNHQLLSLLLPLIN